MTRGKKYKIRPVYQIAQEDLNVRPCAAIMPVNSQGKIFLVRQRHWKPRRYFLEFPMGRLSGEYSLDRAKYKLEEKLNLKAKHWFYLGKAFQSTEDTDMLVYLYLATNVYFSGDYCLKNPELDCYKIEKYSFEEIEELIYANKIHDLITIVLFFKVLGSIESLPSLKGLGKVKGLL